MVKQEYLIISRRCAWDIKEALKVFQENGWVYVNHIDCEDNLLVIVELEEELSTYLEAIEDYPLLKVPERFGRWELKERPTPDVPISVG